VYKKFECRLGQGFQVGKFICCGSFTRLDVLAFIPLSLLRPKIWALNLFQMWSVYPLSELWRERPPLVSSPPVEMLSSCVATSEAETKLHDYPYGFQRFIYLSVLGSVARAGTLEHVFELG
jgi:hypothetical protein